MGRAIIALNDDSSLSGADMAVIAAMNGFIEHEGPELARKLIEENNAAIVILCGSKEKALAICDHCIKKFHFGR